MCIRDRLQGVQAAIALVVLDRYRCLSAELIKIEATRAYVHGVQVARLAGLPEAVVERRADAGAPPSCGPSR